MENITFGNLKHFAIHSVGNKNTGDGVKFSEKESSYTDIEEYIVKLLLDGFRNEEIYQFYFDPKLELNPVYQMVSSIFENPDSFLEHSKNLGKYLYDKSVHPKIKTGELCISYFNNCYLNEVKCDCIAMFKSEEKEIVLKVDSGVDSINLEYQKGISLQKTKKGCIVFNINKEHGFLVLVTNTMNTKSESIYWKEDFLHIRPIENEFNQTKFFLDDLKKIINNDLDVEVNLSKEEKISILNKSIEYFEDNSVFKKENFNNEVLLRSDIIEFFDKINHNNLRDFPEEFSISTNAVKKQKRNFKSIIKLDKNFHIYVHGSNAFMEKCIDEDGRKFYKLYYEDEN